MSQDTPESLNIAQQMNEVLKERIKLQQQLNDAMGGAASMSDAARRSTEQNTETQRQSSQSMTEAAQGSEGLAGALGRQAEATTSANSVLSKIGETAGNVIKLGGMGAAGVAVFSNSFETLKGAVGLAGSAIKGIGGIVKGGVGYLGTFAKSLFKLAVDTRGAGDGIRAALEDVRDEFGDLNEHGGKFVKEMVGDLQSGAKTMGKAGTSLYMTIGMTKEMIGEVARIAKGFGNQFEFLQDQIKGSTFELFAMNKGMKMSEKALTNLASIAKSQGGTLKETLQATAVASAHLSKRFGVDVKAIGKRMSEMTEDMETFGHLGPEALAATATYATKLGVEISALKGVMDKFDSFEGAAESAGKLNEAFGMNIDTMKMMNAENPAERMDMLRKSLEETGKSFEDLSRHEKKLMAQTMGMDMSSLQNSMSVDVDEMGFGDFEEAAAEAADKVSPEEAMMEVAKSIKKLQKSMEGLTDGPFSNFVAGFTRVIQHSPVIMSLMSQIRKWLWGFNKMGREVGMMMRKHILTPSNSLVKALKDIFSLERLEAFKKKVVPAFEMFFKLVKTDPKKAVENLFDSLYDAIQSFTKGSGPGAQSLGQVLLGMIETGLKIAAGLIPRILGKMAEFVRSFTDNLRSFIRGDKKVNGQLGSGIGDAFVLAFNSIKKTVVEDLGPALIDLFKLLVTTYWKPIAKVIAGVFGLMLVKGLVSAMFASVGGGLVKRAMETIAKKFGGSVSEATGTDPAEAESQASSSKGFATKIVESVEEVLAAIGSMSPMTIIKAAALLYLMSETFKPALKNFSEALKGLVDDMSNIEWDDLGKGLAALGGSLVTIAVISKVSTQLTVGGLAKAAIAMYLAAEFIQYTAEVLPSAIISLTNQLAPVNFMEFLKAMGLIATASLSIVATAALSSLMLADGGMSLLIGSAAIIAATAFLYVFSEIGYGQIIKKLVDSFKGVSIMRTLGVLSIIALASPAIMIAAIASALMGVGGALGVFVAAEAGIHASSDFIIVAANSLANALSVASNEFSGLNWTGVLKMMAGIAVTMVAIAAMFAIGGAFALMDAIPFVDVVETLTEGMKSAAKFAKKGFKNIGSIVIEVNKIKISDPEKFGQKMNAIGSVISSIGEFMKIGVGMAAIGSISELTGGPKLSKMVESVSTFMSGITANITDIVTKIAKIGAKLSPKEVEGVKAVGSIIASIAKFAAAISGPLQEMAAIKGNTKIRTTVMTTFVTQMKRMMEGLRSELPKMVDAMKEAAASIKNPKSFKVRVEALGSAFDALVSLVTAIKGLQDIATDKKTGAVDTQIIFGMFRTADSVLRSTTLRLLLSGMKLLVNDKKLFPPLWRLELVNKKLAESMTLVDAVITLGKDLGRNAAALVTMKSTFAALNGANSLPSDILTLIANEVDAVDDAYKDVHVKLGKKKIRPLIDGLMGWKGEKAIIIKPEAVHMTLQAQFTVDAEELAVSMVKGNKDKNGFFVRTSKAQADTLGISKIGNN